MGISVLQSNPLSSATPLGVGATAAAVGTSLLAARGDHRHLLDDSGWLTPTLLNGWVVYDATFGSAAMYRKIGNVVFLRGLIRTGTATAGTVFFVLPAGYRPGIRMLLTCQSAANYCRIDIDTSGNVMADTNVSATWTALNNCIFIADN